MKLILLLTLLTTTLCFGQKENSKLKIDLRDFSLILENTEIDNGYRLIIEHKSDTTFIFMELGDTPEGETLIFESQYKILSVQQKFETSVTVMNQGPHLDLLDWVHYISDWKQTKKISENSFEAVGYTNDEHNKFPAFDITSFKNEVYRLGGEGWLNHVKNVKTVDEYPCMVAISRIYFKIDYFKENIKKSKILVFNLPMGC